MRGIVEYFLKHAPGVSPHSFDASRRLDAAIQSSFDRRQQELAELLGTPVLGAAPTWYPGTIRIARWRRDNKTLALILKRRTRHGGTIILFWCVTDDEATTLEAARSRPSRIAAVAEYERFFHDEIAYLTEPDRDQFRRTKILLDDLELIPERAIPLLLQKLQDPCGEIRCAAVDVFLRLEGTGGIAGVLPLFDDPHEWVRQHVIGWMSSVGDDSVVDPLMAKLRTDPDPAVRGAAAYALGHIGSPRAIPCLIEALDTDKEIDELGHSPSSIAATALDEILGTNQTRIKLDGGLCKLAPWPPDYEKLKADACELYRKCAAARNHEGLTDPTRRSNGAAAPADSALLARPDRREHGSRGDRSMDKLTELRALLKRLLQDYERLYNLQPTPGVETFVIFDEERDHYFLISLGWSGNRRVRRIILYVRIRNGKFWIEEEWTENGIATDLLRAGVRNDEIVLAFQPPDRRPLTEFAVA